MKIIRIDGIASTSENIRNGSYPTLAQIYAVTYKGNYNADKLDFIE